MRLVKKRPWVTIKDFDSKSMYCPCCLSKLESVGSFIYDDVMGHVTTSQKWVCKSKGYINRKSGKFERCLCNVYELYWNDDGDFFSTSQYRTNNKPKFHYGPDTYAAFNSIAKKCETTVYKNGLKKKTYLSPALTLWLLKPVINYVYDCDYLGNISKYSIQITFLKRDTTTGVYCIGYVSSIRMLRFCIKQFKRKVKDYEKNGDNKYFIKDLYNEFHPYFPDERPYKRVFNYYINTFYRKLKKEIEKKKI